MSSAVVLSSVPLSTLWPPFRTVRLTYNVCPPLNLKTNTCWMGKGDWKSDQSRDLLKLCLKHFVVELPLPTAPMTSESNVHSDHVSTFGEPLVQDAKAMQQLQVATLGPRSEVKKRLHKGHSASRLLRVDGHLPGHEAQLLIRIALGHSFSGVVVAKPALLGPAASQLLKPHGTVLSVPRGATLRERVTRTNLPKCKTSLVSSLPEVLAGVLF